MLLHGYKTDGLITVWHYARGVTVSIRVMMRKRQRQTIAHNYFLSLFGMFKTRRESVCVCVGGEDR